MDYKEDEAQFYRKYPNGLTDRYIFETYDDKPESLFEFQEYLKYMEGEDYLNFDKLPVNLSGISKDDFAKDEDGKWLPYSRAALIVLAHDESVSLGDINTSKITDMSHVFWGSERNDYSGIETWDTSHVSNMEGMFKNSNFNHPIESWDVSQVENMSGIFENAALFNQPLSKWDTSHVTNMDNMFYKAASFNQPLSKWDTSSVKTMNNMFDNATSFNQPIDNWNISSVKNMNWMFHDADSFNQPLPSWNLSNVSKDSMFSCSNPKSYSFCQPLNKELTEEDKKEIFGENYDVIFFREDYHGGYLKTYQARLAKQEKVASKKTAQNPLEIQKEAYKKACEPYLAEFQKREEAVKNYKGAPLTAESLPQERFMAVMHDSMGKTNKGGKPLSYAYQATKALYEAKVPKDQIVACIDNLAPESAKNPARMEAYGTKYSDFLTSRVEKSKSYQAKKQAAAAR